MEPLVIHPTATAQWQALVHEAESAAHRRLDEETESYLVFLLMRFTSEAGVANKVLAMDYLSAMNEMGRVRQGRLREVGDLCLIHAGLFPLQAERRRVAVSYFVDLGRSAYLQLAGYLHNSAADTYVHLAQDFIVLMDVLQSMRTLGGNSASLFSPLTAYDLWNDTGASHIYRTVYDGASALPVKTGARGEKQKSH